MQTSQKQSSYIPSLWECRSPSVFILNYTEGSNHIDQLGFSNIVSTTFAAHLPQRLELS